MCQHREYIVSSRLFNYFSRFMAAQRRRTTKSLVHTTIIKLILFLLFVSGDIVSAQSLVVDKKKFFTDEQIIEMELSADFKNLISDKLKKDYETNFQPATITCLFPDSIKITEKIEIRARGQYRREECYMPSIMVNFKTPAAVTLKKLGRLKLVWPCGNSNYAEQLILKEYLVYKIYNLLTERSFRVRLVKISYRDIKEKIRPRKHFAFFIEDVDDVARRNNCVEVQPARPHTEATNRQHATIVALFQYMIGNTDWAVPLYRNIKLIRSKEDSLSLPFTVPYDFDYCGLVNAKYAIPPPELPIISVRERLYRGFPRTMEELQAPLQIFRLQRLAIDSIIMNCAPLEMYHKKEMTKYLHGFFLATEKERNINDLFIKQARRE